jgi:hypothetical protein
VSAEAGKACFAAMAACSESTETMIATEIAVRQKKPKPAKP